MENKTDYALCHKSVINVLVVLIYKGCFSCVYLRMQMEIFIRLTFSYESVA